MPLLFLLITSCHGHAAARAACRSAWLADAPPGVLWRFLLGEPAPGEPGDDPAEPGALRLQAPDDYPSLIFKVLAGMRHALSVPDWEWLGKCDDDTYLHLPRLAALLADQPPGVAAIGLSLARPGYPMWAPGGAGYFMRRDVAAAIIARADAGLSRFCAFIGEDYAISAAVREAGYAWRSCDLLSQTSHPSRRPSPANACISAHSLTPADMQDIKRSFTNFSNS